MHRRWVLCGAAVACVSCSQVLGIPAGTPSFCAQPANQGHAYCEDFDVGDYTKRWTFAEATGGASYGVMPSDDSPPNLIDLETPGVAAGATALAGFTKEFDDVTFTGLHVEADVRFVTPDGGPIAVSAAGFLLIVDKNGGCVGIAVSGSTNGGQAGIGAVTFPGSNSCSTLAGGSGVPAGATIAPLTDAPPPNQWAHIKVDVTPLHADLTGKGTLTFDIVGQPGAAAPVPLAAGTLTASGSPLVGFASELHGPADGFDVQFDNITIDITTGD